MHRLKKWFGVKDNDGRSDDANVSDKFKNNTASKDIVLETDNKISASDTSNTSLENIATSVEGNSEDSIATNVDLWLRARVPLEPGECLSCKIIGTTTILMLTVGVVSLSLRLKRNYTNSIVQGGIVNLIAVTNGLSKF